MTDKKRSYPGYEVIINKNFLLCNNLKEKLNICRIIRLVVTREFMAV